MVILVVFNSFNVVKILKKPDLVARQKPPFYTTYSDYKNCKCRKRLNHKLVQECRKNIDRNEMLYNETLDVVSLNTIP